MSVSSKRPSSFLGLADACPGAGGWQERTGLGSHSFLGKMDHKSAGGRGRGDGDNQLQLGYTEHVHTMSLHRYEELSTKLSAHENE